MLTVDEKRSRFFDGYNTPKDQLLDGSVDEFNRNVKELSRTPSSVKVIPTSDAFRENYDRILWRSRGTLVWEEKG